MHKSILNYHGTNINKINNHNIERDNVLDLQHQTMKRKESDEEEGEGRGVGEGGERVYL